MADENSNVCVRVCIIKRNVDLLLCNHVYAHPSFKYSRIGRAMADENSDGTAVPLRGEESHREEAGIGEVNTGHQTFKERWKNREYRRKLIKTLWLGASFQALVSTWFKMSSSGLLKINRIHTHNHPGMTVMDT